MILRFSAPHIGRRQADIPQQVSLELPQRLELMVARLRRGREIAVHLMQQCADSACSNAHTLSLAPDFCPCLPRNPVAFCITGDIKEALNAYTNYKESFVSSLSLDQLATFVEVIELGSFSAAADRLNISQPAVSLQVRQLEKRLGVRLIERIGRKATPTAAGTELLAHAGRINREVSGALDAMARYTTETIGRVRLGTGATACIYLLPPLLRSLRQGFPSLDITVSTGNTPDMVKAVEDNVLDIALVTMPASGRMLEIKSILRDEFVAVAPAGVVMPPEVTAAELSKNPLILFEPSGNTRRIIDRWFEQSGVSLQPVMSLGSVEAIKELVRAGLGWAILPAMSVRDPEQRRPFTVRPLMPHLHRELALIIRQDKTVTRGLRALIAAITEAGTRRRL